jgi:hypothetical protein
MAQLWEFGVDEPKLPLGVPEPVELLPVDEPVKDC